MLREHGLADEHGARVWVWHGMLMRSLFGLVRTGWLFRFEDAPETLALAALGEWWLLIRR
jgi:hypothetical protein